MFLHFVLVILSGKDIVKRKLTLDALLLEVARESDCDSVRERIAMVKIDVSLNLIVVCSSHDSDLELVLVIH